MFVTALVFMTGILSYFNDNAIITVIAINAKKSTILSNKVISMPPFLTQLM